MLVVLIHHRCTSSVVPLAGNMTVWVAVESQCVHHAQRDKDLLWTRHGQPPIQPEKRLVYTHYPRRESLSSVFVMQEQ